MTVRTDDEERNLLPGLHLRSQGLAIIQYHAAAWASPAARRCGAGYHPGAAIALASAIYSHVTRAGTVVARIQKTSAELGPPQPSLLA